MQSQIYIYKQHIILCRQSMSLVLYSRLHASMHPRFFTRRVVAVGGDLNAAATVGCFVGSSYTQGCLFWGYRRRFHIVTAGSAAYYTATSHTIRYPRRLPARCAPPRQKPCGSTAGTTGRHQRGYQTSETPWRNWLRAIAPDREAGSRQRMGDDKGVGNQSRRAQPVKCHGSS